LDRYITEFCYRRNTRENHELFAITVACLLLGIPLPYAKLIAKGTASESQVSASLSRPLRGYRGFRQWGVASNFRTASKNCSRSAGSLRDLEIQTNSDNQTLDSDTAKMYDFIIWVCSYH
jgi:hypothetical protein